jgi:endo-1,4-beta-mannosidase
MDSSFKFNTKYMENKLSSSVITRRDVLRTLGTGVMGTSMLSLSGINPGIFEGVDKNSQRMPDSEWSKIIGFNYHPSYGSSCFELWQNFDTAAIFTELSRGKNHFPKMNALRWWQSWDSFNRDPERYSRNFDKTLELAEKAGCRVMVCLFNRWHNPVMDFGGIYIDHFLPKASWVQKPGMFDAFMEALVGKHKDDPRILAWDLCNEPYAYSTPRESIPDIVQAETNWLKYLYNKCKELGAEAPVTVGIHPGVPLEMVDPISDVLSIHPYYWHTNPNFTKEEYEKRLDRDVAFALKAGKPLISTENCRGDPDDRRRAETVRYELTQLRARNIGWLVYLLHHSAVINAHRAEFGPTNPPGNLSFIEADGSLRPGHEVFNEF